MCFNNSHVFCCHLFKSCVLDKLFFEMDKLKTACMYWRKEPWRICLNYRGYGHRGISVEWNCSARDWIANFCNVIYTVTHFCTEKVEVTDLKSCQFLLCKGEFSYSILLHMKYVEVGSNGTIDFTVLLQQW